MINTSMPRTGSTRLTTAPPAKIGLVCEVRSFAVPGSVNAGTDHSLGAPPTLGVDQVLLHVEQRPVVRVRGVRGPGTVRFQLPRRRALVERDVEEVADLGDVCRMGDGGKTLPSPVQIAVHQVGRAHAD